MRQKEEKKQSIKQKSISKSYSGFAFAVSSVIIIPHGFVLVCLTSFFFLILLYIHIKQLCFFSCFVSFIMSLPPKNSSLFQEEKTERFKNREPLLRFKKIMEMVKASEKEHEKYKPKLFDLENVKKKNSSSRHFKRWNSDSALRIEDPDIDDGTVFKKTATSSIRPILPVLAMDEQPQPREATDEESQKDSGKREIISPCLKPYYLINE